MNSQTPEMMERFNSQQIRLHNQSILYDHEDNDSSKPEVNADAFVKTTRSSKWYGPYEIESDELEFVIYALDSSGSSEYYTEIRMYLSHDASEEVKLSRRKNNANIANVLKLQEYLLD